MEVMTRFIANELKYKEILQHCQYQYATGSFGGEITILANFDIHRYLAIKNNNLIFM